MFNGGEHNHGVVVDDVYNQVALANIQLVEDMPFAAELDKQQLWLLLSDMPDNRWWNHCLWLQQPMLQDDVSFFCWLGRCRR